MRDQYRTLMLTSFKDATEIVAEFNDWYDAEHAGGNGGSVPPQAVPQIALALYQSRVMEATGAGSFDLPEFDGRMYE